MSKQVYGRKIRRSKNLYKKKKRPLRKALEIIGMIVVIAGLSLVGYAMGKPLAEFLRNNNDETTSGTMEWTPPSGSTVQTETPLQNEETVSESEAENKPEEASLEKAVFAPTSALDNATSLAAYLQLIKSYGYNAVVFDLKDNTGNLWYKSEIPDVKDSDLIKGSLTAKEIAEAVKNNGLIPVARINTLKDHLGPKVVGNMTYRFADDSYSWVDARVENGGKPWANPYLDGTKNYISSITEEAAKAGFTEIILANLIYPNFTPYDMTILSQQVLDINVRYTALSELVKLCSDKKGQSRLLIEVSLKDAVENFGGYKNTAEVLRDKNNFAADGLLVCFNRSETGSELITGESSSIKLPADIKELVNLLFKQAARNLGEIPIIPCIDDNGLSDAEITLISEHLNTLGYDSYMVK